MGKMCRSRQNFEGTRLMKVLKNCKIFDPLKGLSKLGEL